MKTAISIDDHLLHEADVAARKLGLSRSRLFAVAVHDYLRKREAEKTVRQLNRVYAKESGSRDLRTTSMLKAKFRSTLKDRW